MRKRTSKDQKQISNFHRHNKYVKTLAHEREKINRIRENGGYYIDKLIAERMKENVQS
jgi:hypothetical protein